MGFFEFHLEWEEKIKDCEKMGMGFRNKQLTLPLGKWDLDAPPLSGPSLFCQCF